MVNINLINRHCRCGLETLPVELFKEISSYLSQNDLSALCQVSRTCHRFSIPCLFRKLDLHNQKFTKFLLSWRDGRIPHEHFQHVRWFAIRGNEFIRVCSPYLSLDKCEDDSDEEDYGPEPEDLIQRHWTMLVDLIKSRVMTGLVTVVVDGFKIFDREFSEELWDDSAKVMGEISDLLPQNISLEIWTDSRSPRQRDFLCGIIKIFTNTRPIVCLNSYSHWDSACGWTMLLTKHPNVFNHHLHTLKITFSIHELNLALVLELGVHKTLERLTQLLIIPDTLERLQTLTLIHPRDFPSLPPNLTKFSWVALEAEARPGSILAPNNFRAYYVHAWGAIAKLKYLKRLEIHGRVDPACFTEHPLTLTHSVEFSGLAEFIVVWAIETSRDPELSALSNAPQLTTIQSLVDSVIASNPGIKKARISGLSGPSLRKLAEHGQIEMLDILERAPYYNGLIHGAHGIQDDDIAPLTNCPRLQYLRVGRPLSQQILQHLVTACQFRAPMGQGFGSRSYGIYIHISTAWEFGSMEDPDFNQTQVQGMRDGPLDGYLHARDLRSRLGLEWLDVGGDEVGGIVGEEDEYADFEVTHEVSLDLDAIVQGE